MSVCSNSGENQPEFVETTQIQESQGINNYDDFYSEAGMFSLSSNVKHQHKIIDDMKKSDGGYNKIYRTVLSEDGLSKKIPIEIYTTRFTPNFKIRNAVSGLYEKNMYVGRRDEDLFFKAALATGEIKNSNSSHLYFDSPEECERHMHTTISQDIKKKWFDKYLAEKNRRKAEKEKQKYVISEADLNTGIERYGWTYRHKMAN
jgi:hypothetical protein